MKAEVTRHYALLADNMAKQSFSPDTFSHQDHLGVAFELLKRHEFIDAAVIFAREVRRYAISLGASDKFNTTITLAFLSIVAERIATEEKDFTTFLKDNPDLLSLELLEHWYPLEQLNSEFARQSFLMPRKTPA